MKIAEALRCLHHEARFQKDRADGDPARALAILATKLEDAQLWAEHKTAAETMLVNPNQTDENPSS